MPQREIAKTWDVSNTTTLKLSDSLSIKNIVGYREVKTESDFDLDGSAAFIQRFYGKTDVKQFSNEFQLVGTGQSFDWLAGVFYFRETGSDIATSTQGGSPNTLRPSGVTNVVNTSYSAFASGTYRFDDRFSISAGARITHDKREGDGIQKVGDVCGFKDINGNTIAPPCLWHQQASFTEPSWSVSLNYKVSRDVLVYAAHRHGYRSGGIQSRATSEAASVPFGPEKVDDIELGIKSTFDLGGVKLRANVDVYQAWYKGLQRQISFISPVSTTLVSGLINAANSRVRGVEAELSLQPVRGLDLGGSMGYVDGKYTQFALKRSGLPDLDISSQPFSYVPSWTVNAYARYTLPVDESVGDITLSYNFRHQTSFVNSDTPQPSQVIAGYQVSDVRLDWDNIGGTRLGMSVFVNNVFNRYYNNYSTNLLSSLGVGTVMIGAPRMVGVQGRYSF